MKMGRTTSVPKSALCYEFDKARYLLYPDLVQPELKKAGRELLLCLYEQNVTTFKQKYC